MEELLSRYFDGMLSHSEERQLGDWLKASPSHCLQFAQRAKLHDRMSSIVRSRKVIGRELARDGGNRLDDNRGKSAGH